VVVAVEDLVLHHLQQADKGDLVVEDHQKDQVLVEQTLLQQVVDQVDKEMYPLLVLLKEIKVVLEIMVRDQV
tara:strand:- start:125 stop:340 length:216 start_codon:yes stop_codon:yes gene_type:complete